MHLIQRPQEVTGGASKSDENRKSSKGPLLTPPPQSIFGKSCCNFFLQIHAQKVLFKGLTVQNFWIENASSPPLELFQKIIGFGDATRP